MVTLVIGLLLVPMAVFGEETAMPVNESEEIAAALLMVEEPAPVDAVVLSPLFGRVHSTLLMATEEAFEYLLMNDPAEKQAFYDELNTSEEAFAAFEAAAAQGGEDKTTFAEGYELVQAEYGNLTAAADKMFASFEGTGKPVLEDVIAFEASVDAVFDASDSVWVHVRPENGPATLDANIRSLYGRVFSAIEESYAYPVIGDITEKEDALVDFAEFDERVVIAEENFPETSFEELKAMKSGIMQAAETMFASYEKDGMVNADDAKALETLVEQSNEEYLIYLGISSSIEETDVPVFEESAVNATA